ncbi:hypothetical protein CHU98_g2887 [Xylaria longipes]|nr:hypothetical protein CHU98_g2887 [Xylaria longipes]
MLEDGVAALFANQPIYIRLHSIPSRAGCRDVKSRDLKIVLHLMDMQTMNRRAIGDAAERDRWEPITSVDKASDDISSSSPSSRENSLQRFRWERLKRKRDSVEMSSSAPPTATTLKILFLWTHIPTGPDTSKLDVKLASVGTDRGMPDSMISLHHARLLKLIPPSTAEKDSGAVKNIQDLSVEVAWVGKGQEGGIIQCKVSNNVRYDLILGVDFLSMHASALFNERPGKTPTDFGRSLDTSFRFVDPSKRRNFFKRGIVIRTLWPQPRSYDGGSRKEIFKVDGWTEKIHYKITWFVVIQVFKAHCIALPVHTYGGQGTTKPDVDSSNHAALILEGDQQKLLQGEVLSKDPIRMIAETVIDLDQASRINFSKPTTIEYNIKVVKVGRIVSADVGRLQDYFQRIGDNIINSDLWWNIIISIPSNTNTRVIRWELGGFVESESLDMFELRWTEVGAGCLRHGMSSKSGFRPGENSCAVKESLGWARLPSLQLAQ